MDIYNGQQVQNQSIYDNFNGFIISPDRNVFNKLITRTDFFLKTLNVPGDIVECGVFKGTGLLVWLKLINWYSPNSIKKVIGFDFFDPDFTNTLSNKDDKKYMNDVLNRTSKNDLSLEHVFDVAKNISLFDESKFQLIAGDISITSKDFVNNNIGLKISILYMDLDLDEPTYKSLCNFWDRISIG